MIIFIFSDVAELEDLVSSLQYEVECTSSLLIKLLQVKDRHALGATNLSNKMSSILRNYAMRNSKSELVAQKGFLYGLIGVAYRLSEQS